MWIQSLVIITNNYNEHLLGLQMQSLIGNHCWWVFVCFFFNLCDSSRGEGGKWEASVFTGHK